MASYNARVRTLIAVVVAAALALIIYLVVTRSSLFAIRSIVASPTSHITSETISQLAAVPAGSTLFNIDDKQIVERIEQNPWVASVSLHRQLPDQLVIEVNERSEAAVVMLNSGLEAWRISSDGHWLEAIAMQGGDSAASPSDQATAAAKQDGVVLVTEVPATVAPRQGAACTDEAILGVLNYLQQLPSALLDQIVSFKAPSTQGISAILDRGVEISLGDSANQAAWKGEVALKILQDNSDAVTYINVRTPDTPSWRGLESDVQTATGGTKVTATTSDTTTEGTDTTTETTGTDTTGTTEQSTASTEEQTSDYKQYADKYAGKSYVDEYGNTVGGSYDTKGNYIGTYYDATGHYVTAAYDDEGNYVHSYYDNQGQLVEETVTAASQ